MIIIAEVSELTRKIKLPTDRVISVNGDYQVDGIAFKLPATYEGDFDFSTAAVRVHWTGVDKVEHTNLITEEDGNGYPLWIMPSELTQGGHGVIEFAVSFIATDETAAVTKRWISDPVSFRNRWTVNGSSEDEAEEEAIYDRLASAIAAVRAAQASVDKVNEVLAGITNSSPVVVATAADLSDLDVTKHQLAIVRADGYLYYYDGSAWQKGIKYGSYELDTTLTESGKAADAAAVGAKISQIKEDLSRKTGLSEEAKQALLACFRQVAWIDEHGQDYYDALESALYPPAELVRITAVYTQSGSVYSDDSLDVLKPDLVVTAHYTDGTSDIITGYVLSGALTEGTSTITVAYGGKTATFDVTVTAIPLLYSKTESDFRRKTGLDFKRPYYSDTTSETEKRISYIDFDMLFSGGKTYRFKATSTYPNAQMGIQAFNQNALDSIANKRDFIGGMNNVYDPGWQNLTYDLVAPTTINNSPFRGARVTFRQSTANPEISDDFKITAFTIEEVR